MNPDALAFASPAFNGFKNNDYQSGTASISGSIVAAGSTSASVTIPLDRDDSVAQIYVSSNRASAFSLYNVGETILAPDHLDYANGTTPTFPLASPYGVGFQFAFTTSSLVATVFVPNPYSEVLSNIDATYTFYVYTFVAPFAE